MLNLTIVRIESTPEGGMQITAEVGYAPLTIFDSEDDSVRKDKTAKLAENASMMRNLHLGFAQLHQVGG